ARSQNRKALNAAIEAVTSQHESAEWIERVNKAGVPTGPIYTIDQVFADPQVEHLGIAQRVEHATLGSLDLVGQAVTLNRTPRRLVSASPEPGEHTDAILRELGYSASDIADLHTRGVV